MEIELFRLYPFESTLEQLECAQSIYRKFIAENSALEINVSQWVKTDIQTVLEACSTTSSEAALPVLSNLFDVAQRNVYDSLLGAFTKWNIHQTIKIMEQDLGEECEVYSREHRRIAASRLLEYFDHERRKNTISREYCEKFYWLTSVFCKNEIGLEFIDEGRNR
jgi:hypothetical protein